MNIDKFNTMIEEAEQKLSSIPYSDPMYDYRRGYRDGILAVMDKLGYTYEGQLRGFRRVRK